MEGSASRRGVPITLAIGGYDRVRPLLDGRVRLEGVDLTALELGPEEIFFRMLRHAEFDVAELSLSSYVLSLFGGEHQFVAIPVFPSRAFRHSAIYINTASGITAPADLGGKRVGVPEYQMTAGVWIRGILADHHGVPFDSVEYVTGGEEQPGREEKLPLELPSTVRVSRAAGDRTLSAMLEHGEIDALYTARTPSCVTSGASSVARLFPDAKAAEQAYFASTGIFPIMHTVVIRREVYDDNRWLAQTLLQGFAAAKRLARAALTETVALPYLLPWLGDHVAETEQVMGADWWPYGLAANEHTLSSFLRYSHDQHLAREPLKPVDLFAPESTETFVI